MKLFRTPIKFFALLLVVAFLDVRANAADKKPTGFFGREDRRIGLNYLSYGGTRASSLTGTSGLGVNAALFRGNNVIGLYAQLGFSSSSGNAYFSDNGTSLALDYSMLAMASSIGIRLYPLGASKGVGLYVGAGVELGIGQLSLPNRTYTKLKASETGTTFGYNAFGGIEIGSSESTRVFLEAGIKSAHGEFAGNSQFQIEGLTLQGGVAW